MVLMLAVMLIWTVSSINRMEAESSTSRLRDEINVFNQQIARLEADLNLVAGRLSSNPSLVLAMENND